MATVTGYTATKMEELADEQIIDASIVGGELILVKRDLTELNVGNVIGPQGPPGTDTSIVVCTSSTRPTGGDLFEGLGIYETDTDLIWFYDGTAWVYRGGTIICTSSTRPASPFAGMEIYETDTFRKWIYAAGQWRQSFGPADWVAPTLANTWVNYGSTAQTARYGKVNGTVYIEGAIKDGSASSVAFTLPAGYRPAADLALPGSALGGFVVMGVFPNGDFYPCTSAWPGAGRYNINCSFKASA